MDAGPDVTGVVRAWLRSEADGPADEVLRSVLARLDATSQHHSRRAALRVADLDGFARRVVAIAALALAAVAVAAVTWVNLSPLGGRVVGSDPGLSPRPSVGTSPEPTPSAQPTPPPVDSEIYFGKQPIDPGPFELAPPLDASVVRIGITLPSGWWGTGAGHDAISKGTGPIARPVLDLEAQTVSRVATSVCAAEPPSTDVGPAFRDPGPTVDDLATAIARTVGTSWSAPAEVTLGGYPARRLVTTFSADVCPGPPRRWMWVSPTGALSVEDGVTTSVYVVDVDGYRLVITSAERAASPEDAAELQAILASSRIVLTGAAGPTPAPSPPGLFPVSMGPDGDLRIGRHAASVDGVPFSFEVATPGWEPQGGFSINRSSREPQGAETTLRWTSFPRSRYVEQCPALLSGSGTATVAGLANALATAPGVDVLSGPSDATVGGLAARRVVLMVRTDVGCDPGYFTTYAPQTGGAMWTTTNPGDTILVWIVDVGGTLLLIEGEVHADAPSLVDDIDQIVQSMQFP